MPRINPSRLIVSIDVPTVAEAKEIITPLIPLGCMFKIGLELLYGSSLNGGIGPLFERHNLLLPGNRWMFDFKPHDIPRTVRRSIAAMLRQVQPRFFTIHADSFEMLREAQLAIRETASHTKLALVTVPTSHDDESAIRYYGKPAYRKVPEMVENYAWMENCGTVVCAADEAPQVKAINRNFITITPGIVTSEDQSPDQKRTATPAQAINAGADYLVVGRGILNAPNATPYQAAENILRKMEGASPH